MNNKKVVREPKYSLEPTYVTPTNNPEAGYTDEDELLMDLLHHTDDVELCMRNIGVYIEEIGEWHDWTKFSYFDDFMQDTLERQDTPDFKQRDWYKIHTSLERHHINAKKPVDVNLFDVLEMMVDCIVSGKTRTGSVNDTFLVLPQSVLNEAYWNTVDLLKKQIRLKDETSEKK